MRTIEPILMNRLITGPVPHSLLFNDPGALGGGGSESFQRKRCIILDAGTKQLYRCTQIVGPQNPESRPNGKLVAAIPTDNVVIIRNTDGKKGICKRAKEWIQNSMKQSGLSDENWDHYLDGVGITPPDPMICFGRAIETGIIEPSEISNLGGTVPLGISRQRTSVEAARAAQDRTRDPRG